MSGIDWDKEFTLMNPQTPQNPPNETPHNPPAPQNPQATASQAPITPDKPASKFAASLHGVRHNTAALAVCGTIAVLAVCGTVVAVTNMQAEQSAQERARAKEAAENALVEAEAGKQRAQTEEAAAKVLYEREMTVYRECMKIRAKAVAKAASYEVSRIAECDAPTLGTGAPRAQESTGADGGFTSSPWLWAALVGGAGLIAYKKLSVPSGSNSGSGAVISTNDKGFTFEKGA